MQEGVSSRTRSRNATKHQSLDDVIPFMRRKRVFKNDKRKKAKLDDEKGNRSDKGAAFFNDCCVLEAEKPIIVDLVSDSESDHGNVDNGGGGGGDGLCTSSDESGTSDDDGDCLSSSSDERGTSDEDFEGSESSSSEESSSSYDDEKEEENEEEEEEDNTCSEKETSFKNSPSSVNNDESGVEDQEELKELWEEMKISLRQEKEKEEEIDSLVILFLLV